MSVKRKRNDFDWIYGHWVVKRVNDTRALRKERLWLPRNSLYNIVWQWKKFLFRVSWFFRFFALGPAKLSDFYFFLLAVPFCLPFKQFRWQPKVIYGIANHGQNGKWRKCEIKISSNYHANETIELKASRPATAASECWPCPRKNSEEDCNARGQECADDEKGNPKKVM